MRVFFGTVVRTAPVREGGELVSIDWDTKRILRRVPIFPENPRLDHDPNPRGNSRGCRGLAILGERLLAADYHTIRILDYDLNETDRLSHGCMVGLHELYLEDDQSVWVSSTAIDAAIKYSLSDGTILQEFWPRSIDFFIHALNLKPFVIDRTADNRDRYLSDEHLNHPSHLHLNAITSWNNQILALFNRAGAITNLTDPSILVRSPDLLGAHNLTLLSANLVAVNATKRRRVQIYELPSGSLIRDIPLLKFGIVKYKWVHAASRIFLNSGTNQLRNILHLNKRYLSHPLFIRGQCYLDSSLFVGISPATILQIDILSGRLLDYYSYSDDPNVCVHGIAALP